MTRPLGERPLVRLEGLLGGKHLYRSNPEDCGQLVMVNFVHGIAEAEIPDGEDAGEVLLVSEMGGTFERVT